MKTLATAAIALLMTAGVALATGGHGGGHGDGGGMDAGGDAPDGPSGADAAAGGEVGVGEVRKARRRNLTDWGKANDVQVNPLPSGNSCSLAGRNQGTC